ncbi:MAG TPA: tetratricopeptide repeat protein, partial [Bryobacteraceae bacterium]|nr:tetratricopeptide repeat protein [Bryobacteraceae bacterium]
WRLASFGIFTFLLLLAPTSSIVPIQDVLAERRLYLPFIGLALVCLEFLRRLNLKQRAIIEAGVLIALMVLTYQRSAIWGDTLALWRDTAAKSPHKVRPRFHLAYAYYERNQCPQAAQNYEIASRLAPPDYTLLYDWSQALECAGQPDEAVAKLHTALNLNRSAQAWERIGTIYGERNRVDEALAALDEAQKIDPNYQVTYITRGKVYQKQGNAGAAARQYQRAIEINPLSQAAEMARQALAGLQRR